uniref:Uncharacterized protein n=1 Tax=Trichuris muris TaxID=70415 RepID=A0A5S6Q3A5_TRIMR
MVTYPPVWDVTQWKSCAVDYLRRAPSLCNSRIHNKTNGVRNSSTTLKWVTQCPGVFWSLLSVCTGSIALKLAKL